MPVSAPGVVLTVVAVVIGGEAGGAKGPHRIDKGLLDGLRPGDRGSIHYVLTVADEERSIPAGEAVVSAVAAAESSIEVTSERPVHPGYRVSFELPADRLAPAELLRTARENLESPEREAVARQIIEERVLGGDPEVARLLLEAMAPQTDAPPVSSRPSDAPPVSSRPGEVPPVSSRPSGASGGISTTRSLDSAASGGSARDDTRVAASGGSARDDTRVAAFAPLPGMLLVPAGTYTIGAPAAEAAFYNQQPRFETFLEAFWIDAAPLRVGRVGEGLRSEIGGAEGPEPSDRSERRDPSTALGMTRRPPPAAALGMTPAEPPRSAGLSTTSSRWMTDVTWAEATAFCRRLGKRLPTELEWEAAVRGGAMSAVPATAGLAAQGNSQGKTAPEERSETGLRAPILEWTASWYQPYRGNPVSESEYGERYRVLRGARPGESFSATRRRFMAPDARHAAVGFRCVLDG